MSRFFVGLQVNGFPVVAMIEGDVEGLVTSIARLAKYDIQPLPLSTLPTMLPTGASPVPVSAAPTAVPAAPVCRYHGPMKASTKKRGTWFCPKRLHDGSYCPEVPNS